MKHLLITVILILNLTSCELVKEIEFDPNYDGGKIIIHGFISQNDGVQVQINKTVPVNHTNVNNYIPDAEVILYADNIPQVILVQADSDSYISPDNLHLVEGVPYKIKVITQDYGEAESGIQYILPQVRIDSLTFKKDTITWHGEKLLYSFVDPSTIDNYYSFFYEAYYKNTLIESSKPEKYFILGYFNDFFFKGETTWKELNFYSSFNKYDTIQIVGRLYNLSREFSFFLESLNEYEYTRENPFFDYTSPVYSNIQNGYGVFVSYSYNEKRITYYKNQ